MPLLFEEIEPVVKACMELLAQGVPFFLARTSSNAITSAAPMGASSCSRMK
jgi:hypothetical protein